MNPNFKLRFDQMREGGPTERQDLPEVGGDPTRYETVGHSRNVCLAWPDGRRMFLNYAYLVACDYEPGSDRNRIRLSFTSHTVTLAGYGLETLFMALLDHLPRLITATDPRYGLTEEPVVTEMVVTQKED